MPGMIGGDPKSEAEGQGVVLALAEAGLPVARAKQLVIEHGARGALTATAGEINWGKESQSEREQG